MFDGLQERLQGVFRQLKGEGRVSEDVLRGALREIRMALLEADVNFKVVKAFVQRVSERAVGQEVLQSLSAAQQVIKIVRDELVTLLGEEGAELKVDGHPTVVLMCGLQGSGKTTTSGKLARRLAEKGRHPLLVACDLQRAAAVEQLQQVGAQVGVPVVGPEPGEDSPIAVARRALKVARDRGNDVVLIDTAGRLHVDRELMAEIQELAEAVSPGEILFVADAMTGQDAVKSATEFSQALELTGVILTKLDGDARGGAALSIRSVAKVPIRFVGTGEKLEDLETFSPERMTSRILGMGDVLTLIEKAEQGLDRDESERLAKRIASSEFNLEDLSDQLRQMRKLGPLSQVLQMLPKAGPLKGLDPSSVDEGQLRQTEAIINSMTRQEKRNPRILNGSRRKRIARGSGTSVQKVNQLLKQYRAMKKMMKGMRGGWMQKVMGR